MDLLNPVFQNTRHLYSYLQDQYCKYQDLQTRQSSSKLDPKYLWPSNRSELQTQTCQSSLLCGSCWLWQLHHLRQDRGHGRGLLHPYQ